MVEIIDRTGLQKMLAQKESVVVIDALPQTAYARGHIPGALSIPSEEILARAPEILADKNARIVAYCKNGPCCRSERAAERLETLGYRRVYDYHLGRDDWSGAGLPLVGAGHI